MQITQELYKSIEKVGQDIKLIGTVGGVYAQQMQDKYLLTLDLSAALAEKKCLEEQAELLKKIAPPPAPAVEAKPIEPEPVVVPVQTPTSDYFPTATSEPTKDIKVIFYATTAAFRTEMRALVDKYGIEYEGAK